MAFIWDPLWDHIMLLSLLEEKRGEFIHTHTRILLCINIGRIVIQRELVYTLQINFFPFLFVLYFPTLWIWEVLCKKTCFLTTYFSKYILFWYPLDKLFIVSSIYNTNLVHLKRICNTLVGIINKKCHFLHTTSKSRGDTSYALMSSYLIFFISPPRILLLSWILLVNWGIGINIFSPYIVLEPKKYDMRYHSFFFGNIYAPLMSQIVRLGWKKDNPRVINNSNNNNNDKNIWIIQSM